MEQMATVSEKAEGRRPLYFTFWLCRAAAVIISSELD